MLGKGSGGVRGGSESRLWSTQGRPKRDWESGLPRTAQ